MSFAEFAAAVARGGNPPAEAGGALRALWEDARGNWAAAHTLAQEDRTVGGAWVHGYLHRKEGDAGNAAYWYTLANQPPPAEEVTLPAEWERIARALLGDPVRA